MDSVEVKCNYCGKDLTSEEVRLTAEAEGVTVEYLLAYPSKFELMCDQCAEG